MKLLLHARIFLLAALVTGGISATARAAEPASPQQIQEMITAGNENAALSALNAVLAAHPHSGAAWYLVAEAHDAAGQEDAARQALEKAEQYAPGLPFAEPSKVAALQAHLAIQNTATQTGPAPSLFLAVAGVAIVLFVLGRLFLQPRRPAFRDGFGAPFPGGGPGPMGYGPGSYAQPQSGIGGALLGGLVAGAGFAAGERVVDDMFGNGNRGSDPNFGQGFDNPPPVPDRDDGLLGNPGWDDNSSQTPPDDSNFDPGNNW